MDTDSEQPSSAEPPPQAVVMQMAMGFMVAKAVQAAAVLGLADLVADGPRTVADLAAATGTHEGSLARLLRALASRGVFRSDGEGRYANTPLSEALRDVPGSARDYVAFVPHDGNMRSWSRFDEVLRTGEASFPAANGMTLWEYFGEHPDLGGAFNRAMTSMSAPVNRVVVENCDFSRFGSIIDLGGGEGRLLATILAAHPQATGTLLDIPVTAAAAERYLTGQGLADRTTVVAGDLFDAVPSGHDAYVLKHILHDWPDAQALDILRTCRRAMGPGSRLIVVDAVMVPGDDPHPFKWLDLHMLVTFGGRERTADEFGELLAAAGFALRSALPLPNAGIVEADPV